MAGIKGDLLRLFGHPPPVWAEASSVTRRRLLVGLAGAAVTIPTGIAALRLLAADYSGIAGASAQDVSYFRIGGGAVGSRLYQLAGTVAGAITNPPGSSDCDDHGPCGVPGIVGLAQTTAGSVENLENLREGSVESGITQADITATAFAGTDTFKEKGPNSELRSLARLGQASVQIIVAAESSIQTIAELKGKVVALGPKLSDSALTGQSVLAAFGITGKKAKLDFNDTQAAIAAFQAGTVDALVLVDGLPNADIAALAQSTQIRLLPIDGAPAEKLRSERSFLSAGTIPDGVYKGQTAVATLEIPILWTVSAKLDNHLAYSLAKALASQAQPDAGKNAGQINFALAAETGPIRLHPGAQTYYEERRATEVAPSTN